MTVSEGVNQNLVVSSISPLLLFLNFLFVPSAYSAINDPHTELIAFSLNGAKKAISSSSDRKNEAEAVGYISKIWAIIYDDKNHDLILVGEKDESVPHIHIDDVVVALRTIDKIATGKNPGVSIEPPIKDEYSAIQKVRYFGGIENTNYGRICFEADYLLKRLSLGFSQPSIDGFPSEWDLELDNVKAGRDLEVWERSIGTSWFYPHRVLISQGINVVTLSSVTMEVKTDLDGELDFPKRYISLNEKVIADILQEQPSAVSVIYARIFTQNYNEIASKYPILTQLENLLALSGLMAEVTKGAKIKNLDYWLDGYSVDIIETPTEVKTLNQGEQGMAYSSFLSGGVLALYEIKDGWTEAVLMRRPKYVKEAALKWRPSTDAISWRIPLELGDPHKFPEEERIAVVQNSLKREQQELDELRSVKKVRDIGLLSVDYLPAKTLGWHPATEGNNLIAFNGRWQFSSGGMDTYSPGGRFSVAGAELSLAIPMTLQWVYKNRFELAITVPVEYKVQTEDRPGTLPGIGENIVAYVGGVNSPIITNRIQLFDGIVDGRRKLPTLILENTIVVPESYIAAEGFFAGEEFKDSFQVNFGKQNLVRSHGIQAMMPLNSRVYFGFQGELQKDKNPDMGDRKLFRASFQWNYDRDTGAMWGIHFRRSSFEQEIFGGGRQWVDEGSQYIMSLSFPTRGGSNSFQIGWYEPSELRSNSSGSSGTFLMLMDFGGARLWDYRKWF